MTNYTNFLLRSLSIFLCTLAITSVTLSQTFTGTSSTITAVGSSSAIWGDYDNDNDLDVAIIGSTGSNRASKIYRNDGGSPVVFTVASNLTGLSSGTAVWSDYDNDGDLDILISGYGGAAALYVTKLYRNNNNSFEEVSTSISGMSNSSAAFGDFDNDGDFDLLIAGATADSSVTKIYTNAGGVFSDAGISLVGASKSSVTIADYDNDGDMDFVVSGLSTSVGNVSVIYQNTNGAFADIGAGLTGVNSGTTTWGDYDNDGDFDLLISGYQDSITFISKIYQNSSGIFADISAGIIGLAKSSATWGDCDNDGDLDLAIAGLQDSTTRVTKIFRNTGGVFSDINATISGVSSGSLVWADYDKDGDLDILVSGDSTSSSKFITRIYANADLSSANTAPNTPSGLSATIDGNSVTLKWNSATDTQTSKLGLSYNIRVGSTSRSHDIVSGTFDDTTGLRGLVAVGNVNKDTSWVIKNLSIGNYFWTVQSIDNNYAGSQFAVESKFAIPDSNGYRSFGTGLPLSQKGNKMKFSKTGEMTTAPNFGTFMENLFAKFNKRTEPFLGVEQTDKTLAKQYAWLAYKKAAELGKLYTGGPHTQQSYPIDSFRISGSKNKKLSKAIKASRNKYDNPAWAQGVLFNMGLKASNYNLTPPNFGDLILNIDAYLAGRNMKGENLTTIGTTLDSVMTYYELYNVRSSSSFNSLGIFVETALKPINNGFSADLADTNYIVDSNAVKGINQTKNPYAITFLGVKTPTEVGIVNPPTKRSTAVIRTEQLKNKPSVFTLEQNYPNPFNPSTTLSFQLNFPAIVSLKVYNLIGQEVASVLSQEVFSEGNYEFNFDASSLSSGVYFYRLTGLPLSDYDAQKSFSDVHKMVLLK
ncbi:MAG: FG-GAP-like repeat-containing protein [Bacteroidota bacterium]